MKAVILLECSVKNFKDVVDILGAGTTSTLDTQWCSREKEYEFISDFINLKFMASKPQIILVRFSGSDEVAKALGDKYAEMIVTISFNRNSKYYLQNPALAVLNMVNLFEKEIK